MINVRTASPRRMTHLIKSFWFLEVGASGSSCYQEEIVPDGHHEIIFHIDAEPGLARMPGAEEWIREPRAIFAGQTTRSHHLQLHPGSRLYGIRLYPFTPLAFFQIPLSEVTDRMHALETIVNPRFFWDCISEDPDETFARFEGVLERLV